LLGTHFSGSDSGVIGQEKEEMDEKTTVSPTDSGQRSGGVNFHGPAKVSGDVVGRDKNVFGDEVRGDKVTGDKIEGHLGNVGAGAQVAIGKQIQQTNVQATTGLTPSERAEIVYWTAELRHQLANADVPENKKIAGQEFVNQLEEELTKTEEPVDGSIIKATGEWLLKNMPTLAGTLTNMFASPIVGKVVETTGDIATKWIKKRFGLDS
jgi:hypothetical protein